MATLYLVEVGGEPKGPLSGYEVLKLFDKGVIAKDARMCQAGDADLFTGPTARRLGRSELFGEFDRMRVLAATPPSHYLEELARVAAAQKRLLGVIQWQLTWLKFSLILMFLALLFVSCSGKGGVGR